MEHTDQCEAQTVGIVLEGKYGWHLKSWEHMDLTKYMLDHCFCSARKSGWIEGLPSQTQWTALLVLASKFIWESRAKPGFSIYPAADYSALEARVVGFVYDNVISVDFLNRKRLS